MLGTSRPRLSTRMRSTLTLLFLISLASSFQIKPRRAGFRNGNIVRSISVVVPAPKSTELRSTTHRDTERRREEEKKEIATASRPRPFSTFLASAIVILSASLGHCGAWAVSGGGLDYAGLDISGEDYSNGDYKGKDFSQVIAKGTNFSKSNLVGCRFFKAFLVNADYTGADLRGASLEDTSMDGASLKDANAAGAYFSASLLDAKTLENADLTDASLPPKLLTRVCEKENFAFGTNPATGVDTRDSLMCP